MEVQWIAWLGGDEMRPAYQSLSIAERVEQVS